MIVVDASAIMAMLLGEPEREAFLELAAAAETCISPVGYWEAAIRTEQQRGPQGLAELDTLLSDLGIHVQAADEHTARLAVAAARRFGKRTPARLNLGDCCAYALAEQLDAPLLFKGGDFTLTDVRPADPG